MTLTTWDYKESQTTKTLEATKYRSHEVQSHDPGGRHVAEDKDDMAQSAGDKCQGLVGTLGIRKS
jgi:hypothetical protein